MASDIGAEMARSALMQHAATAAFAAKAVSTAGKAARQKRPKGLGATHKPLKNLFVKNSDGEYPENFLTLAKIPKSRAVQVGKQYFNSRSLRQLLSQNPTAANPFTRQPFPDSVYQKYGAMPANALDRVKQAAVDMASVALAHPASDAHVSTREEDRIQRQYGVEIVDALERGRKAWVVAPGYAARLTNVWLVRGGQEYRIDYYSGTWANAEALTDQVWYGRAGSGKKLIETHTVSRQAPARRRRPAPSQTPSQSSRPVWR